MLDLPQISPSLNHGVHGSLASNGLWITVAIEVIAFMIGLTVYRLLRLKRQYGLRIRRAWTTVARRPLWSLLLVTAFSLLLSATLGLVVPPNPQIHDEYSYLLAADTFARGRLTNPPHPMWEHFETFHVIHQPTYMSKYPPAQGLVLAAGQRILGAPAMGQWLAIAFACAATWWTLRISLPARWALFGAILAATHPLLLRWSQGYLPGPLAMLGGAMVLGATLRLTRRPSVMLSMILCVGLAVLANTRPFEGAAMCLGIMVVALLRDRRRLAAASGKAVATVLAPAMVFMLAIGWAMACFNYHVTGSATQMPYALHEQMYAVAPPLLFMEAKPEPTYHHPLIRGFYTVWATQAYYGARASVESFVRASWLKFRQLAEDYSVVTPALTAVILLPLAVVGHQRSRVFAVGVLVCLALVPIETWMHPHYIAVAACALFGLLTAGLFVWQRIRFRSRRVGAALVYGIVSAALVSHAADFVARFLLDQTLTHQRMLLSQFLSTKPGPHLVLVEHQSLDSVHQDLVYNGADIDAQFIVWARDQGPTKNAELLRYYKDRQVWILETGQKELNLRVYPR